MPYKSIKCYLLSLNLGVNSCRLYYAALQFPFRKVLKNPFDLEQIPINKRPKQLPKVINRAKHTQKSMISGRDFSSKVYNLKDNSK
jgi:hypothetical protein